MHRQSSLQVLPNLQVSHLMMFPGLLMSVTSPLCPMMFMASSLSLQMVLTSPQGPLMFNASPPAH